MMKKQEIYHCLKRKGIWYEITEHKAVYNMAELSEIEMPYPQADAKNLFIRDHKKRNYYLLTVKGDKRVDLKGFRQSNHTRPLRFASEQELNELMSLSAGSVTPLGILNDTEKRVKVFIDEDLVHPYDLVGVHPNDNTATVWMKTTDLIGMIKEHGNAIEVVRF